METIKKTIAFFMMLAVTTSLQAERFDNEKTLEAFTQSYINESEQKYDLALNAIKSVYDQESYEMNIRLGWLSYLGGYQSESVKYYERAIRLKPFSIEPKLGITYPLSVTGNWDAIIQQYKHVLEIAPSNTLSLYNLGLIYYNRIQYEEAEKYFKKIVNLYPFDYDGLLMLGWTNFQQKKYREAKVLFQKALLNTPSSESALEGLKLIN
jgi:tetratricopeptide (TPR) repeat protein